MLAAFVLLAMMATLVIGIFHNGYESIIKMGKRSEAMYAARSTVERATGGTATTLTLPNASGTGSITITGELVVVPINVTGGSNITQMIPTPAQWVVGETYKLTDRVRYLNKTYICKADNVATAGNRPGAGTTYWDVVSP